MEEANFHAYCVTFTRPALHREAKVQSPNLE